MNKILLPLFMFSCVAVADPFAALESHQKSVDDKQALLVKQQQEERERIAKEAEAKRKEQAAIAAAEQKRKTAAVNAAEQKRQQAVASANAEKAKDKARQQQYEDELRQIQLDAMRLELQRKAARVAREDDFVNAELKAMNANTDVVQSEADATRIMADKFDGKVTVDAKVINQTIEVKK